MDWTTKAAAVVMQLDPALDPDVARGLARHLSRTKEPHMGPCRGGLPLLCRHAARLVRCAGAGCRALVSRLDAVMRAGPNHRCGTRPRFRSSTEGVCVSLGEPRMAQTD